MHAGADHCRPDLALALRSPPQDIVATTRRHLHLRPRLADRLASLCRRSDEAAFRPALDRRRSGVDSFGMPKATAGGLKVFLDAKPLALVDRSIGLSVTSARLGIRYQPLNLD